MIIIKLQGGLGNQLFQLAAYYSLIARNEVYLDVDEYNLPKNDRNRQYLLQYFNLGKTLKLCIFSDNRKTKLHYKLFIPSIKVFSYSIKNKLTPLNIKAGSTLSNDLNEISDNTYVEGFFMNERFFTQNFIKLDFLNKLKKRFSSNSYFPLINRNVSIAIHIRRTDYLNNPDYEGICTSSYYQKAISFFKKIYSNPFFFFFSDDIAWTIENFGTYPNYYFVKNSTTKDSTIQDLFLMSKCDHMIMANSSFSWWAAFLNKNVSKIIIHPEKYQNTTDTTLFSTNWLNIRKI